MTTVVIADDQALVRDGLRLILDVEDGIEVVGEASNGREAVRVAAELAPHVVLMDVRMPMLDGLAATREIVASWSATRVLMLTTYDEDAYLYEAIRAGASGFLLKDSRREQLVGAIRTVAAGDAVLHPELTRRLLDRFGRGPAPHGVPERLRCLTDRERQVLEQVARGATNAEISAALFLSEATVKTHLAHLTRKLDLRDRVHAVVTAYECGLVHPGE
ncbi:response regulator [Nocardioides panaciterrulae]|uniref:DNA-binding NarL/FixJ family response regulator n=1 Tax=Nocardioides panaciterrulae TaxID=661492 RepID=A0A7Y9J9X5_9ACTN|nr:DNA-binding NarL/FixJ family response regulator [Nocardioides panaciterrulae]